MFLALAAFAHVARAEEDGADGEEEEEIDPDMKSTTVMVILTAMVVFSVGFEVTKDKVLEDTKEDLEPVVNSLFAELTVLGFIGLTLFLVDKMSLVGEISEELYGEEGYIGELCEIVHMVLFLVMLLFMGTVVALIQFGNEIAENWKSWEDDILDDDALARDYNEIKDKRMCQYQEPMGYQRIAYAAIRQHFLLDLKDEDIRAQFDFSGYLIPLLGRTLAEIVEIPISTWVALEFLMLGGWYLQMNLTDHQQVALLVTIGYALPIGMRLIHNKIRAIKADVAIHSGLMEMAGLKEEEMIARGEDAVEGTPINSVVKRNGYTGLAYVKDPHPCAAFVVPQYYDCEHLIQLYGRSNLDTAGHGMRFWFANTKLVEESKEAPEITLGIIRFSLLLNSIYMALFGIGMVPAMIKMVKADEMSILIFGIVVFFCLLPPISLIWLTPMVVKDFVMVANIQNMRNKRVVEQGIRRIQTRNAFLSLKVIYMMLHGAKREFETKTGRRKSTHHNASSSADTTITEQKKKRIVWKQIFNIFDDDHQGSLTHEELGDLLRMADPKISKEEVKSIINELDADGGGDVDFEEFFEYAEKIEERNGQSAKEISAGIFELVDQGSRDLIGHDEDEEDEDEEEEEDEIDIQELQNAMEKMKQALSADDVYEVIKDIDEDGNGRLNKEEFHELLIRLDVIAEDEED
jgi:Ca2+-binding EF-hand superfamily protein